MGENGEAIHLQLKLPSSPRPPPLPSVPRRRRDSIGASVVVVPTATKPPAHALSLPNGTAASPPPWLPPLDLSGQAFASYTSLKDLLPAASLSAAASSPTTAATAAAAASSSYEVSIRNRLVNRAAWAYLRPMSASPGSDGPKLLHRLWLGLSSCLGFICEAFDRIVRFFLPVRSGR